ncbi:MAG: DUF2330 domain-containing protein, partial [Myxococcales bacterium]|nr:DUF2330 domain-containing protein [Myxococcales bacterium]
AQKKKPKAPPKPPVEGSYEIAVLEGKGADMVAALKAKGVTLSSEVEPLIVAYGDVGMKLVVAEINTSELDGNELPPLMIHSKAQELTLPTRLHAAGKSGPLDVFVLSPHMRFEAKNQKNQAIPTNLDVKVPAAKNPSGFYSALVARTFADAPDAVITEYAWRALDCEGCAAPLDAAVISRLGVALLPSASTGGQQEVIVDAAAVSGEPGGPDDMRKALMACYGKTLASTPGLGATVTLDVVVKDDAVQSAKSRTGTPEALVTCATEAAKAADLDESGALTITFSPTSRKFLADMVLTKLRVQQAAVPEKDLMLGAARAIEGGRENGPEGKPEKKVYWAEATNNFQPRYVLRHPWKGAVKCLSPQRGSFSAVPPKGEKPAGKGGGAVPALESMIEGGLPELTAYAIASSKAVPPPPAPTTPTDSPAPESSATPSPSSSAPPPPSPNGGCGCAVTPRSREGLWLPGLFALGWLARRARRKQRATGR